jgi:hypothetical protein
MYVIYSLAIEHKPSKKIPDAMRKAVGISQVINHGRLRARKEKKNYAGSKTLPASI